MQGRELSLKTVGNLESEEVKTETPRGAHTQFSVRGERGGTIGLVVVQRFDRHGLDTERAEEEASVQLWDVTHTFPTSGGIHEHGCLGEFTVDTAFGFVSLQDYQTHRARQPFTGTLLLLRQSPHSGSFQ